VTTKFAIRIHLVPPQTFPTLVVLEADGTGVGAVQIPLLVPSLGQKLVIPPNVILLGGIGVKTPITDWAGVLNLQFIVH